MESCRFRRIKLYTHRSSGLTGLSRGASETLRTLMDNKNNRLTQHVFVLGAVSNLIQEENDWMSKRGMSTEPNGLLTEEPGGPGGPRGPMGPCWWGGENILSLFVCQMNGMMFGAQSPNFCWERGKAYVPLGRVGVGRWIWSGQHSSFEERSSAGGEDEELVTEDQKLQS